MRPRKLTDAQKAEMRQLYLAGHQIKQLAARFGVGKSCAWLACHGYKDWAERRQGGPVPRPKRPKLPPPEQQATVAPTRKIAVPPTLLPGSELRPIPLSRLMGGR